MRCTASALVGTVALAAVLVSGCENSSPPAGDAGSVDGTPGSVSTATQTGTPVPAPQPPAPVTISLTPVDDRLDCAPPSLEVITFDWTHPDPRISLDVPNLPGVPFKEGRVRIRITNHSRHKILTSGAWLDMAWRDPQGVIRITSSWLGGKYVDEIPRQIIGHERAETVRGHDSIEFSEYIGVTHLTDGSSPWVHEQTIRWAFENPDLENACRAQNAEPPR